MVPALVECVDGLLSVSPYGHRQSHWSDVRLLDARFFFLSKKLEIANDWGIIILQVPLLIHHFHCMLVNYLTLISHGVMV